MEEQCTWYDVPCHFNWLQQELKQFSIWVYENIIMGIVGLFESIDPPEWLSSTDVSVPANVLYFYQYANINLFLAVFISAYIIRFLIRRIPIIG